MKWALVVVIVLVMISVLLAALLALGVTVAEIGRDLWGFLTGTEKDSETEEKNDVYNRD